MLLINLTDQNHEHEAKNIRLAMLAVCQIYARMNYERLYRGWGREKPGRKPLGVYTCDCEWLTKGISCCCGNNFSGTVVDCVTCELLEVDLGSSGWAAKRSWDASGKEFKEFLKKIFNCDITVSPPALPSCLFCKTKQFLIKFSLSFCGLKRRASDSQFLRNEA